MVRIQYFCQRLVGTLRQNPCCFVISDRTFLSELQQHSEEDFMYTALKQAKTLKLLSQIISIDINVEQFQMRDYAVAFHKIFAVSNKRDRIDNERLMEQANKLNRILLDSIKRQIPVAVNNEVPSILFTLSRYDKKYRMQNAIDLLMLDAHHQLPHYQIPQLKTILVALAFSNSNLKFIVEAVMQQLQQKLMTDFNKSMSPADGEVFSGIVWAIAMLKIDGHDENMNLIDQIVEIAFREPEKMFRQNDVWSRFLFGLGALNVNFIEKNKQIATSMTTNLLSNATHVDLVHYLHAFAQLKINSSEENQIEKLLGMIEVDLQQLKPHSVHELICSLVMLRQSGGMVDKLFESVKSICLNSRKLNKKQKLSLLKGMQKLGCRVDLLEEIMGEIRLDGILSDDMMDHVQFRVV
eukprot:TRINITY_DN11819_c0_g2_i4.p1 TRINITY_DN11819_c0_g2~~TRINITY_DN11819_c0_g2_i4.p1  ORF type:complete len:409 (+),score=40.81 TRINITY_DN11819_c0_g2_i4:25-1251(+)